MRDIRHLYMVRDTDMKKVLVIAGPTASGKSGFAVECAKRFNGEIITGESIQIYRGHDILTDKIILKLFYTTILFLMRKLRIIHMKS